MRDISFLFFLWYFSSCLKYKHDCYNFGNYIVTLRMEPFCKIWQNRKKKEAWFPSNSIDSRVEFLCIGGLVARYFFLWTRILKLVSGNLLNGDSISWFIECCCISSNSSNHNSEIDTIYLIFFRWRKEWCCWICLRTNNRARILILGFWLHVLCLVNQVTGTPELLGELRSISKVTNGICQCHPPRGGWAFSGSVFDHDFLVSELWPCHI